MIKHNRKEERERDHDRAMRRLEKEELDQECGHRSDSKPGV